MRAQDRDNTDAQEADHSRKILRGSYAARSEQPNRPFLTHGPIAGTIPALNLNLARRFERSNRTEGRMRALSRVTVVPYALMLALVSAARVHAAPDACRMTAADELRSCQVGARSDHWLALGKCDNQPDRASRRACAEQAAVDAKDALGSCVDQANVREGACGRLGPAPYHPAINPANFVATIDNPFFPLVPGTTFVYETQTPDGLEHDEFAITHNTRVILGVTCTEVHDTVMTNGVLTEDTLDWFAQDTTGNVWYFGENTHELADGLISTIDGTFMGGSTAHSRVSSWKRTPRSATSIGRSSTSTTPKTSGKWSD